MKQKFLFIPVSIDEDGHLSYYSENWVFETSISKAKKIYKDEFSLIQGEDYDIIKKFLDITEPDINL
jgi:hypothetical protein